MIAEIVRDLLAAEATVAAIVADRIHPVTLPDAPTFPAIVVTKVSGVGEYDLEGDAGLEQARVQLDLYSDTGQQTAVDLRTAVRRYLSGLHGVTVGSDGACMIQGAFCINDLDLTEIGTERAGPRLRRRLMEFIIWNRGI